MRVLADNDVVLDFLLERKPFNGEAKELFRLVGRKKLEIYVASITPVNAFYTIRKERDKQTALVAVRGIWNSSTSVVPTNAPCYTHSLLGFPITKMLSNVHLPSLKTSMR